MAAAPVGGGVRRLGESGGPRLVPSHQVYPQKSRYPQ